MTEKLEEGRQLRGKIRSIINVEFDVREYPKGSGKYIPVAGLTADCVTETGDHVEDYFHVDLRTDPGFKKGSLIGLNLYIEQMRRERYGNIGQIIPDEVQEAETKTTETHLAINSDEVTIT